MTRISTLAAQLLAHLAAIEPDDDGAIARGCALTDAYSGTISELRTAGAIYLCRNGGYRTTAAGREYLAGARERPVDERQAARERAWISDVRAGSTSGGHETAVEGAAVPTGGSLDGGRERDGEQRAWAEMRRVALASAPVADEVDVIVCRACDRAMPWTEEHFERDKPTSPMLRRTCRRCRSLDTRKKSV